jgi:hypothetical protein
MENILTKEEKRYLTSVTRYLKSIGLTYGSINFELQHRSLDDIDWDYVRYFDNKYGAEIPEGFIDILKKIINYIIQNNIIETGYDDNDYEYLEIEIYTRNKVLTGTYNYGLTEPAEENSLTWDEIEDPEVISEIFGIFEELGINPSDGFMEVQYSGSGDSGYLENNFTDGSEVPSSIEDWCYQELESNYGGWEINEGSQGSFLFNFKEKEITLSHSYNEQKNESEEVFSFDF